MTKLEGEYHRMRRALEAMQGHVFYVEDEEGRLRRWYPPKPPQEDAE